MNENLPSIPLWGQSEYLLMPFGLQGPPGVFMNFINKVLHKFLYKGVFCYLDDMLIYSDNYETHVKLVQEVLSTLYKIRDWEWTQLRYKM